MEVDGASVEHTNTCPVHVAGSLVLLPHRTSYKVGFRRVSVFLGLSATIRSPSLAWLSWSSSSLALRYLRVYGVDLATTTLSFYPPFPREAVDLKSLVVLALFSNDRY